MTIRSRDSSVACVDWEHADKALSWQFVQEEIPMNWIFSVGYTRFPLTQAGISGQFQDVPHLIVTAAVVHQK